MSDNNNLTTEGENSKEEMLYKNQLLKYKYKTCLVNTKLTDTYDPDTMNSLKKLMLDTNIEMDPKKNSRYQNNIIVPMSTLGKSAAQEESKNVLFCRGTKIFLCSRCIFIIY